MRLADGTEQVVGQWAAGEPAEGLAFFARKYDDLAVEVDLATRRLRDGKVRRGPAAAVVKKAREALAEPAMVGDLGGPRRARRHARGARRRPPGGRCRREGRCQGEALAAREAIVARPSAGRVDAVEVHRRPLQDAARRVEGRAARRPRHRAGAVEALQPGPLGSTTAPPSTSPSSTASGARPRRPRRRSSPRPRRSRTSTDWGATAGAYPRPDGPAGRPPVAPAGPTTSALWDRFRAAQDTFFAARNGDVRRARRRAGREPGGQGGAATEAEAHPAASTTCGGQGSAARRPGALGGGRPRPARPTRSGSRAGCGASSRPSARREEQWGAATPRPAPAPRPPSTQLETCRSAELEKTLASGADASRRRASKVDGAATEADSRPTRASAATQRAERARLDRVRRLSRRSALSRGCGR